VQLPAQKAAQEAQLSQRVLERHVHREGERYLEDASCPGELLDGRRARRRHRTSTSRWKAQIDEAAARRVAHKPERPSSPEDLTMPMIPVETSVAAGASNPNLVTGSAFEFARARQIVSMGWGQAATGGFMVLQSGGDVIAEEFSVPILTRYPIVPDEMYFTDVMEVGDRLVARYRNPTGGAIIVRGMVQISGV
jgi:hypothetical protein